MCFTVFKFENLTHPEGFEFYFYSKCIITDVHISIYIFMFLWCGIMLFALKTISFFNTSFKYAATNCIGETCHWCTGIISQKQEQYELNNMDCLWLNKMAVIYFLSSCCNRPFCHNKVQLISGPLPFTHSCHTSRLCDFVELWISNMHRMLYQCHHSTQRSLLWPHTVFLFWAPY